MSAAQRWSLISLGLLVLGALAALGGWLALEEVEEEERFGASWRARANPYLALERLLTRLGLPAESHTTLPELLPGAEPTLVLVFANTPLPASAVDELATASAQGVQLVVGATGTLVEDPLLVALGLEVWGEPAAPIPLLFAELLDRPRGVAALRPTPLSTQPRAASPRSDVRLQAPAGGWEPLDTPALEDGSFHLAARPPTEDGRWGAVMALSDPSIFDNEHLLHDEHAALAWELANTGARRALLVVRSPSSPSVLGWLVAHAAPTLTSLGALCLAWMLWVSRRFGPLEAPPDPTRRQLGEALAANGAFLWRTRNAGLLVEALRAEAVLRRFGGRLPQDPATLQQAARRAGLDPAALEQALRGPPPTERGAFVRAVATLSALRRSR